MCVGPDIEVHPPAAAKTPGQVMFSFRASAHLHSARQNF